MPALSPGGRSPAARTNKEYASTSFDEIQKKRANQEQVVKVFVSGCYDILHAGHLQFFREARALGGENAHLTVSFASFMMFFNKISISILFDLKNGCIVCTSSG